MLLTSFVAKQILALAVEMAPPIVHLTEYAEAKSGGAQISSDARVTMAVRGDDCERLITKGAHSGAGRKLVFERLHGRVIRSCRPMSAA
jgi:hypothetical protein